MIQSHNRDDAMQSLQLGVRNVQKNFTQINRAYEKQVKRSVRSAAVRRFARENLEDRTGTNAAKQMEAADENQHSDKNDPGVIETSDIPSKILEFDVPTAARRIGMRESMRNADPPKKNRRHHQQQSDRKIELVSLCHP